MNFNLVYVVHQIVLQAGSQRSVQILIFLLIR